MAQVIDLRDPRGSAGQQIMDTGLQVGQQMLQFFLQKEQLGMQQQQIDMEKETQKARLAEIEGQAEAGRLLLGVQALNPEMAERLRTVMPEAFDTETGAFNPEAVSTYKAAALAQHIQGLQAHEMQLERGEAEVRTLDARTLATQTETKHATALFPTIKSLKEAEVKATQAQADLQQAQARAIPEELAIARRNATVAERSVAVAEQQFDQDIRESARALELRRRESAGQIVGALGGGPLAEGIAARLFYGANTIPAAHLAIRDELATLRGVALSAEAETDLASMLEDRAITGVARRIGVAPEEQAAATAFLERHGGDPQAAINAINVEPTIPKEERTKLLAEAVALYTAMGHEVQIPAAERSGILRYLENILDTMLGGGLEALQQGLRQPIRRQ